MLKFDSSSVLKVEYNLIKLKYSYFILSANNRDCNNIYKFESKSMALFGSNYVCQQLFLIKMVKTSQRTRLTDTQLSLLVKVEIANSF